MVQGQGGRAGEQEGYLETAHITLAICEAVANAPEVFSESEMERCRNAIREKGMFPCVRFCGKIIEEKRQKNNWFMVMLDGFGTAAALLNDLEYVKMAVEYSRIAASLYNDDSYGESMQYSNYATLHLSHLNEILLRSGLVKEKELNLTCYTNLMVWYAASFLYCKPLKKGKPVYPRTVNFGNSTSVYRTTGDVLVQVASRMKNVNRQAAGLASWMFRTMYSRPSEGPDELASFGFFNQFQYYAVLMLPACVEPVGPAAAGLDKILSFSCGHILARNSWENTKTVVALQAGYQAYRVSAHRHKDQNSFQLVIGKERMLIDPGHCCYRLKTQWEAASEFGHNTFSIKKDGIIVEQEGVGCQTGQSGCG